MTVRKLSVIEYALRSSEAFLGNIASPAFLLTANCTVVGMNSRAHDAVNRNRGLFISPLRRLLLENSAEAIQFEKLVFDASDFDEIKGSAPSGFLTFMVSGELPPNSIFIYPMVRTAADSWLGRMGELAGRVLVTVHYRQDAHSLSEDRLRTAFGFTSSESQVVLALASGLSASEFAERSGRSIHTVRLHLKRALMKADCHSKFELMSVLFKTIGQPI